jgi:hypothetical protein|nr:MAG: putative cysteine protease [Lake Baikal virophage 2]
MDHIGYLLRQRAEAEARGEIEPYDAKKAEEELIDGATNWVKDQFLTKEEKEEKAKKKREEIEERERKEREAAGPSLADLFSGFKFGSGKNPFYHLQGGMINPFDKDGNMIDHPLNPFDKDGKRKPREPMEDDVMFQKPFVPEFDWIENERRTTNPFYHLQGAGQIEDFIGAMDNPYTKDKITQGAISSVSYLGSKLLDHLWKGGKMPVELVGSGIDDFFNDFFADIAKDGIKKGMEIINKLKGSGWEDDLNEFVADQLGKLLMGGIAHNPKGHTKRNNNLTKQKPQQKKFCGFKSKVFEHEDYDPAKMHKFRAATCGAKPLTKAGRPAGSKNTQGYTKSGQFTSTNRNLGQSRRVRERLLGEGKQLQIMPKEDDLVSKKENPIVEKIIEEPMDDGDIRAYFPKARVMRYAELADYDTIEQLLPKNNSYVFLLYQHRVNDGHFVCLMRYGKTIEFFCSYGSKIDGPLSWTPLPQRVALGEGKPYLTMLLRKAPQFDAIHNPVAFQSKTRGIATCGAYCVMRVNQLVNHGQDLHDFIDYMEEIKKETKLSYDEIAANYVAKR